MPVNKRIFIVDDEPDMLKIATDVLEAEGYVVSGSTHPVDALKKLRQSPPDLVLLDVRLPDMDGFQVCREIKNDPKLRNISVIMISVKSDETDVVVGLEMGAEDYISKPFRRREMLARVKSVLRRNLPEPVNQKVTIGPLVLDYASHSVTLNRKPLAVTPKEFNLLGYFLRMENRILTRAQISEAVWGVEFTNSTRTIDVHVDQLRKKLGKFGDWIKGLKGVGYRFEAED